MSDDRQPRGTAPAGGKKPRSHHDGRGEWSHADRSRQSPPPTRSGKTLHHPAFRIGEIKHGKR